MLRITRAWDEAIMLHDEDGSHVGTITVRKNKQERPEWDAVLLEIEVPDHIDVIRTDRKFDDGR